jgi:hypothetical protein
MFQFTKPPIRRQWAAGPQIVSHSLAIPIGQFLPMHLI